MTAERVRTRWPVLVTQIESALHAAGESVLAATLGDLNVVYMYSCQDDFCQSFHSAPPPEGAYKRGWSTTTPAALAGIGAFAGSG